RLDGAAVPRLLRRDVRRFHHLERGLDVERVEDLRDDDHTDTEPEEEDRRVRHLVADPLDAVEHPLGERAVRGLRRGCRAAHDPLPLDREANSPKNSDSATTAFSNSSSSTRSFGAWMFAKPSVVPIRSISASGTASWSAFTSGIDPPEAKLTASLPQAA